MTGPAAILVTMRHVRAEGLCAAGVRRWFARRDRALLVRFCGPGVPVEEVEALGDAYALRVARRARQEAARG